MCWNDVLGEQMTTKKIRDAVVETPDGEVRCRTMSELLDAWSEGCAISYYDWGAGSSRSLEMRDGGLFLRGKDIDVVFRDDAS